VKTKIEPKAFLKKKDNTPGVLGKVVVTDDAGGKGIVLFWTEQIDDYNALNAGDTCDFEGFAVKYSEYSKEYEFSSNKNARVAKAPAAK